MRILMTSVVLALAAHASTAGACELAFKIPGYAVAEPAVIEPAVAERRDPELPWWPSIAGLLLLAVLARRHPPAPAG